jgi:hypothetical protein
MKFESIHESSGKAIKVDFWLDDKPKCCIKKDQILKEPN